MSRIFNFSAGPATLPVSVLEEVRDESLDFQGAGMSIMEMSHRGKEYTAVHEEAIANVRELMDLGDDHAVLLLQGGATGQFAMVPANLLPKGQTADYINGGSWGTKAIKQAQCVGNVHVAGDTAKEIPTRMPTQEELTFSESPAYVHLTSNETISGAQYKTFPSANAPLVADMSSDILSRRIAFTDFGLIYAGAQKNLGPSGVTLVVLRKDLAEAVPDTVPPIWRYKDHMEANSLLHTPPCFGVYVLQKVTRWIKAQGGLDAIEQQNRTKAAMLYDLIDGTEFYRGTALPEFRSDMNVTFRLPDEDLEARFVKEAGEQGLSGLKGHRSVGGIRASIYNAMPTDGVRALVDFMKAFEQSAG